MHGTTASSTQGWHDGWENNEIEADIPSFWAHTLHLLIAFHRHNLNHAPTSLPASFRAHAYGGVLVDASNGIPAPCSPHFSTSTYAHFRAHVSALFCARPTHTTILSIALLPQSHPNAPVHYQIGTLLVFELVAAPTCLFDRSKAIGGIVDLKTTGFLFLLHLVSPTRLRHTWNYSYNLFVQVIDLSLIAATFDPTTFLSLKFFFRNTNNTWCRDPQTYRVYAPFRRDGCWTSGTSITLTCSPIESAPVKARSLYFLVSFIS